MKINKITQGMFQVMLAAGLLLAASVLAQTNLMAPDRINAGLQTTDAPAWVLGLVAKYPWLATVLLFMGALRVVAKPVFSIWHNYVKSTDSTADDEFLARVENSRGLRWMLYLLDWGASVKLTGQRTEVGGQRSALRIVLVFFTLGSLGLAMGCIAIKQRNNIVGVTETVIGLQLEQSPANETPRLRFGYVRSQFHVVPTLRNTNEFLFAPPVLNSIALERKTGSGETLNEDFATGEATRYVNDIGNETVARAAVRRQGKTNAVSNVSTNR